MGTVAHPGSVAFDAAKGTYTVTGGGENMWITRDAFQFAWKRATGDLTLAADISFVGAGKDPHRKACLMIRQDLDADSAYVDVAVHGDGLTSLQFREAKGGATHEVQANVKAPKRVRIEKRGKYVTHVCRRRRRGSPLLGRGRADRVPGAVLCRHRRLRARQGRDRDGDLRECRACACRTRSHRGRRSTARWRRSRWPRPTGASSTLRPTRIEAPNWLRDGQTLIYNSGGRLFRIPAAGGTPELIDTGFATRCNNDHGVSPDGTQFVISDQSQGDKQSLHLHAPDRRRDAEARHADRPVLLARLVPRRQDAGLLRRARRRVRYLHHPRRGRRRDTADHGQGTRRRPRVRP